jgi:hypothetical protein
MPATEADTCRKYVLPNLYQAGWTDDQINEQHTFTDGRVSGLAQSVAVPIYRRTRWPAAVDPTQSIRGRTARRASEIERGT